MLEISSTNKIIGNTYSVVVPDIYEQFKIDGDAEVFETVALDYLLTKHADDTELIEYIMSLPKSDKRMATILAIDGDNVLWSKMNSFVNGCVDKFEHVKDVIKIMSKFVKDGEIEKRNFGEVMTPITLVKEMLDTLPKEVWSNPNLKWLDPCNGAGTFPYVVIYKLMFGLKGVIDDDNLRYKHIVENMIYTCELQSRNVALWLCGVDPKDEYTTNTYWGSFLDEGFDYHMKNVWGIEKFDIVIGNPPYQKSDGDGGNGSSAVPIYNIFTEKSIKISNTILFITPSRWFSGGRGLDIFRNMMINRNDIKMIKHFNGNGADVFGPNVEIKGGVSYFLIDKSYNGDIELNGMKLNNELIRLYGSIFYDNKHYDILNKIKSDIFFNQKVQSSNYFGKTHNGVKTLRNSRECVSDRINDDYLKCYVSKKEGFIKYVNREFSIISNLDKYKVFTVKGTNVGSMGNTFIGYPNEICTETYLTILCESESESNNIIEYFKTDLVKYLFKLMNITQNSSKETYRLIPYLNFDKNWSDCELNSLFNLTNDEISFIKNFIK